MNVRPITAVDIPHVLPLVEQYCIFEDIAGYDASRIGRELLRLCEDPRLGAGWLAEEKDRPVGYLLGVFVFSLELPSARGHEAARDFYRRQGYSERSGFELLDKMLPQ